MKKIIALFLCMLMLFCLVSCKKESADESTTTTKKPITTPSTKPVEVIKVEGKTYKVDIATINFGWNEGNEPTQITKDTFLAFVKNEFGSSCVVFTDENSFELRNTNNNNHDVTAQSCLRTDNEIYAELTQGSIDIMVYKDKITLYCDFFAKGWNMYFSIDYLENKE